MLCLGRNLLQLKRTSVNIKLRSLAASATFKVPKNTAVTLVQFRSYARKSARRTTVEEDQRTTTNTGIQTNEQQRSDNQQQHFYQQREPEIDENETTESALTPDVRVHLTKVYGTMTAGFGLAGVGALLGAVMPALILPAAITAFIGTIGFMFIDRSRVTLRQNLFLGVAGLLGMTLTPLLAISSPGVILAAAVGTSGIFGGFTLAALKAKRKSMLMLGGPLIGGLFVVLFCAFFPPLMGLLGIKLSAAVLSAFYNVYLYLGLGVFSLFVAYDTQLMIEAYKAGDDDHVSPAFNMFLNLLNIFKFLLQIFGGGRD
eukprot:TRINITY_DN9601_c0_g1_i1.p1 TRINITY_DN9601_c0_g1~~TRINITY_DN9601_c0_g1_i1.p1  ORF type:complete len:315 (+),score=80.69 TRINITY_DN9601_c0_g1_i1:87-1031(+)